MLLFWHCPKKVTKKSLDKTKLLPTRPRRPAVLSGQRVLFKHIGCKFQPIKSSQEGGNCGIALWHRAKAKGLEVTCCPPPLFYVNRPHFTKNRPCLSQFEQGCFFYGWIGEEIAWGGYFCRFLAFAGYQIYNYLCGSATGTRGMCYAR